MTDRTRSIFVLLSLMIIIGHVMPAQAKPPLEVAVKRQQLRNDYTRFETVIDALDVTDGMTILDIGAGPGYASFLFAEALHGTGAVYATDIRDDFVTYIAEEAKRRGLTNLFSALVQEEGLDVFYGKHRYDLVFISNVYHVLKNRVDYFGKLRTFLNPGARLVLVLYNQAPLFSREDFSDIDGIRNILSAAPDDDPFVRQLSPRTRLLLSEKSSAEELVPALVEDFNRMLTDPLFFEGFYDGSYFRKKMFTAPERDLANWLLMILREEGIFEIPPAQTDAREMRTVIKLNRLIFRSRFGDYLSNSGRGAYIPAGDANRHTSKYEAFRELSAAGYRFHKEIKLSPYFDAVIMVPAEP